MDENTGKKKILVVDDVPTNIKVLLSILTDNGYTVFVATNGEMALEQTQYSLPDLILLDIQMPGIDGYETCIALKKIDKVKDIPVIFMSALSETTDKVLGFRCGGVDYITKPFQGEEILERIKLHLKLHDLQKQTEEQNLQLKEEIAEREKVQKELAKRENYIRSVVENASDGIVTLDENEIILSHNSAVLSMLNYSSYDLLNKNAVDFVADEYKEKYHSWINNAREDKVTQVNESSEICILNSDGTKILVEVSLAAWKSEGKKYFTAIIRDITARKEVEGKLEKLRHEYEAFMRHELKNMLTPIKGFADLLQALYCENLSEKQMSFIKKINEGMDQIITLIDHLKKLQDFENGNVNLELMKLDVFMTISDVITGMHGSKCIEIDNKLKTSKANMDIVLIPGVFNNLIKNAVEHVENLENEGDKIVKVNLYNEKDEIVVEITNKGKSIPNERLATFFEKFNTIRHDKAGGTGLGTTYAYLVTKAHGGEISVSSDEVNGTCVRLKFEAVE